MEQIKEGRTFDTWEDFFACIDEYTKETAQPFVRKGGKLVTTQNQRLKGAKKYPEHFKYCSFDFRCSHQGKFSSVGEGVRKTKSFKNGCPAQIKAVVDKTLRKVVVQTVVTSHNHPFGRDIYCHYPLSRKLDQEETSSLEGLARLKVSSKMLRKHAEDAFGKVLRLADVRNLKTRLRMQDRTAEDQSALYNDAQMLVRSLKDHQDNDPDSVIEIGVTDDGVLRHYFFQSSAMRQIFSKFPGHILIDCTYCLNDKVMPLLTFLCIDGNNESRVVGFAVVGNESKDMLCEIFSILKKHNSCCSKIRSFMVDKDMAEISALQEIFPSAVGSNAFSRRGARDSMGIMKVILRRRRN